MKMEDLNVLSNEVEYTYTVHSDQFWVRNFEWIRTTNFMNKDDLTSKVVGSVEVWYSCRYYFH